MKKRAVLVAAGARRPPRRRLWLVRPSATADGFSRAAGRERLQRHPHHARHDAGRTGSAATGFPRSRRRSSTGSPPGRQVRELHRSDAAHPALAHLDLHRHAAPLPRRPGQRRVHRPAGARDHGRGVQGRRLRHVRFYRRLRPRLEVGPRPGFRHLFRQVRPEQVRKDLARTPSSGRPTRSSTKP